MELIFELLGTPTEEEMQKFLTKGAQKFIRSLEKKPAKKLESIFPKISPLALDLLKKMLLFDPEKRISVEKALDHPYLEALHCSENEMVRESVKSADFEFEEYSLTIEQMKDLIYEEILLYNFPEVKAEYERKKKEGESLFEHILKAETNKLVKDNFFLSSFSKIKKNFCFFLNFDFKMQ